MAKPDPYLYNVKMTFLEDGEVKYFSNKGIKMDLGDVAFSKSNYMPIAVDTEPTGEHSVYLSDLGEIKPLKPVGIGIPSLGRLSEEIMRGFETGLISSIYDNGKGGKGND
jgi:hypothetical protein